MVRLMTEDVGDQRVLGSRSCACGVGDGSVFSSVSIGKWQWLEQLSVLALRNGKMSSLIGIGGGGGVIGSGVFWHQKSMEVVDSELRVVDVERALKG
jgi:hypothetical protein